MKTLFYHGTILTMEEPLTAQAVLIEKGTILAVGTEEALRQQAPDCEAVDLQGATLMPGFLDPHSHFFQVAIAMQRVSLEGAVELADMRSRVQTFIRERGIAPGQWVNARDYDNNLMPELRNPTLAELDTLSPENPLVIHHKSGHMGLMNSLALQRLGITPETPCPEGGKIEQAEGKLTGYLEENAFFDYLKKIPMAGPQELLRCFEEAQKQYASYGITTLQDGMVVDQMLDMYRYLIDRDAVKLDVLLYAAPESYDRAREVTRGQAHIQVGGMKIFLDGSPQGRTAWMRTPYQGTPDYCGYGTMTDEAVTAAMELAGEKHTQIIAHCNGDGAAEQFIRCLEQAQKAKPQLRELRPVLIHGQLLGVDQLPRLAELRAMVSFFVAHVYHWGDVHIRNFGLERAARISPAHSALQAGVPFTFHQDAPVIAPDMLETIWCAVNRQTREGVILGQEEAISTLEALRAVTINSAYQYGQEDRKGSLAPGKLADFVVLDRNPLQTPKEELRDIRVLATYKEGERIYTRA